MIPQPGQVWRDNLAHERVTVTEVIAPAVPTAGTVVRVSYDNGHAAVFAAAYFDLLGCLGFTRVAPTHDHRFGGGA